MYEVYPDCVFESVNGSTTSPVSALVADSVLGALSANHSPSGGLASSVVHTVSRLAPNDYFCRHFHAASFASCHIPTRAIHLKPVPACSVASERSAVS